MNPLGGSSIVGLTREGLGEGDLSGSTTAFATLLRREFPHDPQPELFCD
jgi:hypothetical protein